MNAKITKLRTERGKNETKISDLQARNREIDKLITELENTDILGLVRASGMTADQLAALIVGMKDSPMPAPAVAATYDEQEEMTDEE